MNEITSSVATGANVGYYINLVVEKYTLRRMIEVATNVIRDANNSDVDVSSFVEEAEKNILNVSKSRRTSEFRRVQDVLSKTQEDLEMLSKNKGKVTGLTTGLIDLDNLKNSDSDNLNFIGNNNNLLENEKYENNIFPKSSFIKNINFDNTNENNINSNNNKIEYFQF